MESRVRGNPHARFGAGEKAAIASKPYLLLFKSETALLQALVLYLVHEAPEEEQNLPMVMEMLQAAEVREEDDEYESPLDMLFSRLEMRDPESIALKQYRVYKMAAGKTAKSILVSVGVRLSAILLPEVAKMTCTDELHL